MKRESGDIFWEIFSILWQYYVYVSMSLCVYVYMCMFLCCPENFPKVCVIRALNIMFIGSLCCLCWQQYWWCSWWNKNENQIYFFWILQPLFELFRQQNGNVFIIETGCLGSIRNNFGFSCACLAARIWK